MTPTRSRLSVACAVAFAAMSAPSLAAPPGTILPGGTLPQLQGVAPSGVTVAAPQATATGRLLSITQAASAPRAVLNWSSFNIARGSEVQFLQPGASSAILNRIFDQDPSIIQGRLTANGQIFLINQNGILFDRGSQVSVGTLVASTLNMTDARFQQPLGATGIDATTPAAFQGKYNGTGPTGVIRIGAFGDPSAPAPQIETRGNGGLILMAAPQVDNQSGILRAPDGQVILTAGSSVFLAVADGGDGNRGLVVQYRADNGPVNLNSLVQNFGDVSADRGNVTLAGLAVNQGGRVSASTAAVFNGTVFLQARDRDGKQGAVSLLANSVTQTPIDATDTTVLRESQAYGARGTIRVEGKTIVSQGTIAAPGGKIDLIANDAADPLGARIYLDTGSLITAAGTWTDLPYEKNLVSFRVTSNELKDSPDQKGGILAGMPVTVDVRRGSTLLDISGYADAIQRSVGEKAATGGNVNLQSAGDLILRAGAAVDVSGGGYRYASGNAGTTVLLGADGVRYDISTAPAGVRYVTQLDSFSVEHSRWGAQATESFVNPFLAARIAPGYVEGKPAGTLSFSATRGMVLDGSVRGGVTVGTYQSAAAPAAGSLTIGGSGASPGLGSVLLQSGVADNLGAAFTASTALTSAQANLTRLSTDWLSGTPQANAAVGAITGFGSISLNSNGTITIPSGVAIEAAPGASVTLRGTQIDVAGSLVARGGTLNLQTRLGDPTFLAVPASERLTLGAGALLSTAGAWVNTSQTGALDAITGVVTAGGTRNLLNGGSITIASTSGTALLSTGSVIDASGGGWSKAGGSLTSGNGGSVSIDLGTDPASRLGSDLRAYALGKGGSLALTLPSVTLSGTPAASGATLAPAFFTTGGFTSYAISGNTGVVVASGTTIAPTASTLALSADQRLLLGTGASLSSAAARVLLPSGQRPVSSLTLRSFGDLTGGIRVESGAAITTDPRGQIALATSGNLTVGGTLSAPAGSISLALGGGIGSGGKTLTVDSGAQLLAGGVFVPQASISALRLGDVLAGGTVTLDTSGAPNATLDVKAGSRIDVRGASATLDLRSDDALRAPVAQLVTSDAGLFYAKTAGTTRLQGTLLAQAQGASAGGSFALDYLKLVNANDNRAGRIVVSADGSVAGGTAGFLDAAVNAGALQAAGFDKVRLFDFGNLRFAGNVNWTAARGMRIDAGTVTLDNGSNITLTGANVALASSVGGTLVSGVVDYQATNVQDTVSTVAGTGVLSLRGPVIDLSGSVAVNGAATLNIGDATTREIRLSGRQVGLVTDTSTASLVGGLRTTGNVNLMAGQVYPTTGSAYEIAVATQPSGAVVPGGRITISRSGQAEGVALSAGGRLTLTADSVIQDGTLKAPLGQITVNAATIDLKDGSLTSVSGAGLTVPYGSTVDGVLWNYATTGTVTGLPGKRISLNGTDVSLRSGAKLDISGGGDILGVEFVPGSGGSKDVLLQADTYAIVPTARLAAMPVDTDLASKRDLGFARDGNVYNAIHIGAGAGVPEGDYTLLPGYYAQLPGAYAVQLLTSASFRDLGTSQRVALGNGQFAVGGYRTVAGTAIRESRNIGVLVRPASDWSRSSEYLVSGSDFFTRQAAQAGNAAPRAPGDGGQLALAATRTLQLDGTLVTSGAGPQSRLAEVDITASRIAVVDQVGQAGIDSSYLQLDAGRLSGLGASLLLGGTRSDSSTGRRIDAVSSRILVANTSADPLRGGEILLAARDVIDVATGATVSGTGATAAVGTDYTTGASGALLRVSNGAQVNVTRDASPAPTSGQINVASGAQLSADRSMLLDAAIGVSSQSDFLVGAGGSLSLAAAKVSLGQTDGVAGISDGLVLSNTKLAGLNNLGELVLKSRGGIDFYGAATVGGDALGRLTLDAAALRAATAGGQTRVRAGTIVLRNSSSTSTPVSLAAGGSFDATGGTVVVSSGTSVLRGYSTIALNAAGEVVGEGTGGLQAEGALSISSRRISTAAGANQNWLAGDGGSALFNVSLASTGTPLPDASSSLGSRLLIAGKNVTSGGRIEVRSGAVTLEARGAATTDGVSLLDGASIDVSGRAAAFDAATATFGGGQVTLNAAAGDVSIASGSRIDVSAPASAGDAGQVTMFARNLSISGSLQGTAGASGAQGRFSANAASLGDFSALNASLNQGGFSGSRELRQRAGNLVVGAADQVRARNVVLSADAGSLTVLGRIDASAPLGGGNVELYARDNLTLGANSVIDASATSAAAGSTAPLANGGSVLAFTQQGTLTFDPAATINLRPGARGNPGSVTFVAPRLGSDNVQASLRGTVLSRNPANPNTALADVIVEGHAVYQLANGTIDDLFGSTDTAGRSIVDISAEAADFAVSAGANWAAFAGQIKGDNGLPRGQVQVRPRVELRAPQGQNLTLNTDLDLTADWVGLGTFWLQDVDGNFHQPGTLSLRSDRNVVINAALGMPSADVANNFIGDFDNFLMPAKTWGLQLAGGADFTAANPMAVQRLAATASFGDVQLPTANSQVRTGTGSVRIAAARDFTIGNRAATVTTTGLAAESDFDGNTGFDLGRWVTSGGAIDIRAGRDAKGVAGQWITDWYRRTAPASDGAAAEWWSYRPNFRQNVGSFGGGDVSVSALRNVDNLSAMLPTAGNVTGSTLQVTGGGNLRVQAGGDVIGGEYLVARGSGSIEAAGAVRPVTQGSFTSATQLYLMGVTSSSDAGTQGASLRVTAGAGASIQSVANPTAMQLTNAGALGDISGGGIPGFGSPRSNFYTYSPDASVAVAAKGGDLSYGYQLADKASFLIVRTSPDSLDLTAPANPPSVRLWAPSGSISQPSSAAAGGVVPATFLFPSTSGRLEALAGSDVRRLTMTASDLDPANVPSWNRATISRGGLALGSSSTGLTNLVTRDGTGPVFVVEARDGSIVDATLGFPAAADILAGKDILRASLTLQNLADTDVTVVRAKQGRFSNVPQNALVTPSVTVRGPGRLLLQAGGDIDLGSGSGLKANGADDNASLPVTTSARLSVVAGVSSTIDLAGTDGFFDAIRSAGIAKDTAAATAATNAYLGAGPHAGSIRSFRTAISTTAGSGVDLIAPGGDITVGLTSSANSSSSIGVTTLRGGAVSSYLSGNFNINGGKVLTAQGGDILIYTSEGNIDAGRGAKTSAVTSGVKRVRRTDSSTGAVFFTYELPVDAVGSGIRTLTSARTDAAGRVSTPPAGSIFLFAPQGFVDAGEAGIASGGNLFIAALQVLNAVNITSQGSSQGVPVVSQVSLASGLTGATGAAAGATQAATDAAARAAGNQSGFRPSFITVEVIGLGS